MDKSRIIKLIDRPLKSGTVIYWMSRDQRVYDNWALLFAQNFALETQSHLEVVFCLQNDFLNANTKHFNFMLEGLKIIQVTLSQYKIPFHILAGNPIDSIPDFLKSRNAELLITDFDPLKIKRNWKEGIRRTINIPFYEIDTHNIVPVTIASDKQEWSAKTIHPKINNKLPQYLTEFPSLVNHPFNDTTLKTENSYKINSDKYDWIKSGENEAYKALKKYIDTKLDYYHLCNQPDINYQSDLSPYIHFGQISAQRIALEIIKSDKSPDNKDKFLEQLIIRKELSDNYCYYNENYDNFEGFPNWAKNTLNSHIEDKREFIYSIDEFENKMTHDILWNSAQNEMIETGKMHGYIRMYWAKKILEWSPTPHIAQEIAIYLNDKYSLDGRDPNGYTGIAWSIGGVHDRPWFQRQVFGLIRFMSYNGISSKYNIKSYIARNSNHSNNSLF